MRHYIYIFLIGVLLVLLVFQTYTKNSIIKTNESNILAINDKIEFYETSIGQLVESKRSVILERDNFKFLSDSLNFIVKNFKKVDQIIEYKYIIKTDTVEVPLIINPDNSYSFRQDDGFNIQSGTVYNNRIKLDPLIVRNDQSIITGWKKNGWFKNKEYHIDIHNSNPYIQGEQIQHFIVVPEKSWHEKWYITGPIGLGLGFILSQ